MNLAPKDRAPRRTARKLHSDPIFHLRTLTLFFTQRLATDALVIGPNQRADVFEIVRPPRPWVLADPMKLVAKEIERN